MPWVYSECICTSLLNINKLMEMMIRAQLWNREQFYIFVLRMFEKITLYLGTGVKIYQIFLRQDSNHYSQFFSLSECVQKALILLIVNFRRHLNPPYFFQFKAPRKKNLKSKNLEEKKDK